jgi:serine/threonine-protein kinase ULK/ATG1
MKSIRDAIAKEMLQCEIEALKTLSHPNVLKCHEVFTTVNNCYIVTELCSEGDLASLIKTKKRLAETDANSLIGDIVAGFLEIADKNYLHRDLKLANIFISRGVAKIADFGFAKRNTNPGEREKYNVGSPLYMSPEALKKNIYTIKNDIWSIGVIIY